ncbi:MAG: hypoxanthine phosphoribosyltransferase [Candidatus Bipolaricaulota bacterium]
MNNSGYDLEKDIERVVYRKEQILDRVEKLAGELDRFLRNELTVREMWNRPPIAVCILRGAAVFMADLTRKMDVPIEYDFMAISSYQDATEPGEVRVIKDLDRSIHDRIVLVIEDIIDTGETMNHILRGFEARDPRCVKVCSLIDKVARRKVDLEAHFTGFTMEEDLFIVGYGMDYAGRYRNLPYIGVLKKGLIEE